MSKCEHCGAEHGFPQHTVERCRDALVSALAAERAKREEAERAYAACAHAIGVEYEADGHASQPGPVKDVVRHIEETVERSHRVLEIECEIDAIRERAEALTAALREVAYKMDETYTRRCVYCDARKRDPHESDCVVGSALSATPLSAPQPKGQHVITIVIAADGSVQADLDDEYALWPRCATEGEATTLDGQSRSVLQQALLRIFENDCKAGDAPVAAEHPGDWLMRPHRPGEARNVCGLCRQMTQAECTKALLDRDARWSAPTGPRDAKSEDKTKPCGDVITIRDDEHQTLVCFLDAGHDGPHRAETAGAEWTDATTHVAPPSPGTSDEAEQSTCCGKWIGGSGGHRVHEGGCNKPADWYDDDDMFSYCEDHCPPRDKITYYRYAKSQLRALAHPTGERGGKSG